MWEIVIFKGNPAIGEIVISNGNPAIGEIVIFKGNPAIGEIVISNGAHFCEKLSFLKKTLLLEKL